MGQSIHKYGRAWSLALICLGAAQVQAAGTVELTLSTGWVSGSISGMPPPWPFSFRLDGSFAENSRASIAFDDLGVPSLTVDTAAPGPLRRFVLDFDPAGGAPAVTLGGTGYAAPQLQTFDTRGRLLHAVSIDTSAGLTEGSTESAGSPLASAPQPVPEPATLLLWLAGLAALPGLARRRGA